MDKFTGPSGKYKYYDLATINAADINLVLAGGSASRELRVYGAGTLVTTPANPIGTGDVSHPVVDGDPLPMRASAIKSTTAGITGVLVFW